MNADTVNALSDLDDAIAKVEAAREAVADNSRFAGSTSEPGSEGFFGPVLHDLRVLRGRVADPVLHD